MYISLRITGKVFLNDFMLFSSLIPGPLACPGRFNRFLINAKYRPGFRRKRKARNQASTGNLSRSGAKTILWAGHKMRIHRPVSVKKTDQVLQPYWTYKTHIAVPTLRKCFS